MHQFNSLCLLHKQPPKWALQKCAHCSAKPILLFKDEWISGLQCTGVAKWQVNEWLTCQSNTRAAPLLLSAPPFSPLTYLKPLWCLFTNWKKKKTDQRELLRRDSVRPERGAAPGPGPSLVRGAPQGRHAGSGGGLLPAVQDQRQRVGTESTRWAQQKPRVLWLQSTQCYAAVDAARLLLYEVRNALVTLWTTDGHGRVEPGVTPLMHLATVASSFIMLNESTEDTLYNVAQVANITQLVGRPRWLSPLMVATRPLELL